MLVWPSDHLTLTAERDKKPIKLPSQAYKEMKRSEAPKGKAVNRKRRKRAMAQVPRLYPPLASTSKLMVIKAIHTLLPTGQKRTSGSNYSVTGKFARSQ